MQVSQSRLSPHSFRTTDFLVLGGGVAGLRAAIELAKHGKVLIVAKGGPQTSSSLFAQGGVAVALHEEDHVDLHLSDTLKAGARLCRKSAVKILVEEGPIRVEELIEWGAHFDKIDGQLAFTMEGAHSRHRILRAGGDATGSEMVRVLTAKARGNASITRLGNHFAIDLLISNGRCTGAVVLDEGSGELLVISALGVVLATGGCGQAYARTTNPASATGDGMVMALRAGAVLEDMEFVQFHPTALYLASSPPFLLSEAMRGEGGVLRNAKGQRFMKGYHSAGELAPRDIVARSIWSEMEKAQSPHVYLDVTHLGSSFIKKRFPTIYATCLRFNLDITEEWIPVSPSAHYMMGGVKTNLGAETSIPGLFAAGEVACTGVHGANRLASNSLLEGLVFGMRVAQSARAYATRQQGLATPLAMPSWFDSPSKIVKDMDKVGNSLRRLLSKDVGLLRTGEQLKRALAQLIQWEKAFERMRPLRQDVEIKNLVQVGRCIAEAALWRESSVGAHYRIDCPSEKGISWRAHSRSHRLIESEGPPAEQRHVG